MKHLYLALISTLSLGTLSASVMPAEYHLEHMTDQQKKFLTKNAEAIMKRYPAGDIMHEMAQKLETQDRAERQAIAAQEARQEAFRQRQDRENMAIEEARFLRRVGIVVGAAVTIVSILGLKMMHSLLLNGKQP